MTHDVDVLPHSIDVIATLCLDSGIAVSEIYLPMELLAELKNKRFAYASHGGSGMLHPAVDHVKWQSSSGIVNLVPQLYPYRVFNVNASGMVSCDIGSVPSLLLLNKLLRLKIYDPSPV